MKVLRVWFDKQLNASAPDILETPDFFPVNLIAQYNLLEDEYKIWAQKTGGSVLEFHCYTWSKYFDPQVPDSQVWPLIAPTIRKIYPEIFNRQFQVLAYHVNSYRNFASFEHGLAKARPYTDTMVKNKLNNIYLAGDWIRTPFPSALMERAVSTGRLAANEILIRDRVKQAQLTVISSQGPGIF
jgi:isorenieratene synthase